MRGLLLEVPDSLLEERRRTGIDKLDEMWEGVLHMAPPPGGEHQRLGTRLLLVFATLAEERGLVPYYDSTGFYTPGRSDDWRIPDSSYVRPDHESERGIEGAALVVEIRSPRDETYDKLNWYAARGVDEVLVVHPESRMVELFARQGEGMTLVESDPRGVVLATLGARLQTVEGPALRITWDGGSADV